MFGKIQIFENCRGEFHFCRRAIDYRTFASAFFTDVKEFELERLSAQGMHKVTARNQFN